MNFESMTLPDFYLDTLPNIANTKRLERIRRIRIQAGKSHVFAWLNQLRIAPYSYDLIDNRGRRSPHYIIKNLPPLAINTHFLLAFHIQTFESNSYLVGHFCEPINKPVNSFINGLYIEYRLINNNNQTELWCKVLGFVKKDISSKMFFLIFSMVNKIMMTKQLKTIRKLSEKLAQGEIEENNCDLKRYYAKSGLHWWLFCRRHNCKSLIT